MRPFRNIKFEHQRENQIQIRSKTSESDISDSVEQQERPQQPKLLDLLDRAPIKMMRMEVNLNSERRENDFYIYDKKVSGGLKITEYSLIFSRKKLDKEQVRVEANPLRLPNKLIFFEYDCKY